MLLILTYTSGCGDIAEEQPGTEGQQTIVDSATGEEVYIDEGGSISLSMGYPETLNPLENRDLRVDKVLSLIFPPQTCGRRQHYEYSIERRAYLAGRRADNCGRCDIFAANNKKCTCGFNL